MNKILVGLAVSAFSLAACSQPRSEAEKDGGSAQSGGTDGSTTQSATAPMGTDQSGMGQTGMGQPGMAQPGTGQYGTTAVAPTMTPQDYVAASVSSDQFQIQASQLALQRTKNPAVTRFAKMMVADHRTSTGAMTKAAAQAGLVAPRFELMPKHQALLDALRSASGTSDQVYLEQQRAAHAEAITMHRSMATTANVPEPLAAFARDTLPGVEAHAKMLADMNMGKTAG